MPLRVWCSMVGTAVTYVVLAFAWRTVFPFPDTLAAGLPQDTLAYAHLSLTTTVRRAFERHAPAFIEGNSEVRGLLPEMLRTLIRATDIRELGFVLAGAPSSALRLELLVGRTPRTDTLDGTAFRVWRIPGTVRVLSGGRLIRTAGGPEQQSSRHPVSVRIYPRTIVEFPTLPFRPAAHLLPEELTFVGVLDRWGVALRSRPSVLTGTWWWSKRLDLPSSLNGADVQVIGFPARALLGLLSVPINPEAMPALESVVPERADIAFRGATSSAILRFASPRDADPPVDRVLLGILALVSPVSEPRILDGFVTNVLHADPDQFSVNQEADGQWVVREARDERAVARIMQRGGQTTLLLGDGLPMELGGTVRVPIRCVGGTSWTTLIAQKHVHPQVRGVGMISWDVDNATICGFLR